MVQSNIELTDVARYNDWLKGEWGIESQSRFNQSPPIIRLDELDSRHRQYIAKLCEDDLRVYDRIVERLDQRGTYHVFGSELI